MKKTGSVMLRGFIVLLLIFSSQGWVLAGGTDHEHSESSDMQRVVSADWKAQLKAQIRREETQEGDAGRADQVDRAMDTLMSEIQIHQKKTGDTGPFSNINASMQMDRSWFLGPTGAAESVTGGGRCPTLPP